MDAQEYADIVYEDISKNGRVFGALNRGAFVEIVRGYVALGPLRHTWAKMMLRSIQTAMEYHALRFSGRPHGLEPCSWTQVADAIGRDEKRIGSFFDLVAEETPHPNVYAQLQRVRDELCSMGHEARSRVGGST